jgi:hypothetical protein
MNEENNYIQTILNNHWFDPKLEVVVFYGQPRELGGPPEVYAIPGKFKPFERTLVITEEEYDNIKLGDWMSKFEVKGLEVSMHVYVNSVGINGGRFPSHTINLCFS